MIQYLFFFSFVFLFIFIRHISTCNDLELQLRHKHTQVEFLMASICIIIGMRIRVDKCNEEVDSSILKSSVFFFSRINVDLSSKHKIEFKRKWSALLTVNMILARVNATKSNNKKQFIEFYEYFALHMPSDKDTQSIFSAVYQM